MEAARSQGILPNNGLPEDRLPPPNNDHLAPELDVIMPVYLFIGKGEQQEPTYRHWSLVWVLPWRLQRPPSGYAAVRTLELTQEFPALHLTNWGPLTRTRYVQSLQMGLIPLGKLSFAERQLLEQIAKNTPVYRPNGIYNCQHWVIDVISKGIHDGLPFDRTPIEEILRVNGRPDLLW
ncbi:hypothetical protein DACRYDRAFT_119218 [Dacryopinax primogenitus]|uniref:Uncharacterized protein n=1 Tax=Dacryopinax primogenitus (strain DJM 731) TaxID=1858805 RepID=M5FRD1_DACPD|nr:uncharacterized protein DACRYDRAFT_119218 [Dacryopinax primogenitus]EJT97524.1 hypothetical protein DACRYDRAFT_119218 [Dacryopinax primogenitus]